jgi:NADPH:quinone reductase-like Zn-dependent oxidoreductase
VYFAGNSRRQGSYAEYLAIDERIVGRKPKNLTFEQAACEPLTALTAYESFIEGMRIFIPHYITKDDFIKLFLKEKIQKKNQKLY